MSWLKSDYISDISKMTENELLNYGLDCYYHINGRLSYKGKYIDDAYSIIVTSETPKILCYSKDTSKVLVYKYKDTPCGANFGFIRDWTFSVYKDGLVIDKYKSCTELDKYKDAMDVSLFLEKEDFKSFISRTMG